jgi:2-polyprenyl-3-methyl-5-hydroxy-6-metoxy-1,4-benzoquinol methylase
MKDTELNSFDTIPVETVASYWDKRPCNIRHSPSEPGTKKYYDEVEARKYFVEPHIPGFADFNKWKGKKVLEIGCGIGTDTINFARAGAIVTAVDLSKESIKIAKQRAEVFGLSDRITFYNANAEELSKTVPPAHYDLIYSFGVIHHTPHPEKVIEEIQKHYVSENSTFKIMMYNRYSLKSLRIILTEGKCKFWQAEKLIAKHSEAQTGCPVTYTYTRKSLKKLLSSFQFTNCFVDHIFPYTINNYVQYKYIKIWPYRFMPKFLFRMLERCFGWHLCATSVPRKK